jgi:hypothetical protein
VAKEKQLQDLEKKKKINKEKYKILQQEKHSGNIFLISVFFLSLSRKVCFK